MIKEIAQQWDKNKDKLQESFQKAKPSSYGDIFKQLFELVLTDKEYDTNEIVNIDHGHYQGTEIFIIHEEGYQPSADSYLVAAVYYGSCSGCDTLQAIDSDSYEDVPTEDQVKQYMTLALHIVQGIKPLFGSGETV